jgi:hypothetical protein
MSSPDLYLGHNLETGTPVTLSPALRKKHLHIIGASGTGKSFAMLQMILQDIRRGDCAVALLDPHGSLYDLVAHELAHGNPELAERMILFDPAGDTGYTLGFNPLGDAARYNPDAAVNLMVMSCLKAWGQQSTDHSPRITRILRNIFAVLVSNGLTIVEAACLISTAKENPHRDRLLENLVDEHILNEWLDFRNSPPQIRATMLEGAQNRLHRFLSNPRLTNMFGQQHRVIRPLEIIENKQVLLVNLRPNISIDAESNRLLGVLLINEFYRVSIQRDPEPTSAPHPFYFYIDEFYHYLTRDIAHGLDGTRKFGTFFRLAHQHLAQLGEEDKVLEKSVLTNCRAKLVFGGLTYEDADLFARHLYTDPEPTMAVKHRNEHTAFRPVEVQNITHTYTGSETHGVTQTTAEAHGESRATNRTRSTSETHSETHTHGESHQWGYSDGTNTSRSHSYQQSNGHATAQLEGESIGLSVSHSDNSSDGVSDGTSRSTSSQETNAMNESRQLSDGNSHPFGNHDAMTVSHQQNYGSGSSTAQSVGENQGQNHSVEHSEGTSDSVGLQNSRQTSTTRSRSESVSTGSSETEGESHTRQRSWSTQESHASGTSHGETNSNGTTEGTSEQRSESHGESQQRSRGVAVSVGVRHRMDEFTQETPVFWNLQEIRHRQICQLMDLPNATAVLRVENGPPQLTRIAQIDLHSFDTEFAALHTTLFQEDVITTHPEYYLTLESAQAAISERQMAIFGTTFRLGLTPSQTVADETDIIQPEDEVIDIDDDSPFPRDE